jgi:hypothetical protein
MAKFNASFSTPSFTQKCAISFAFSLTIQLFTCFFKFNRLKLLLLYLPNT